MKSKMEANKEIAIDINTRLYVNGICQHKMAAPEVNNETITFTFSIQHAQKLAELLNQLSSTNNII